MLIGAEPDAVNPDLLLVLGAEAEPVQQHLADAMPVQPHRRAADEQENQNHADAGEPRVLVVHIVLLPLF